MGFWKSVGETALKIGKKAIDSTNAALKEAEKHKIEYRKYDDGKLKQILATGSFAKKWPLQLSSKKEAMGKKIKAQLCAIRSQTSKLNTATQKGRKNLM